MSIYIDVTSINTHHNRIKTLGLVLVKGERHIKIYIRKRKEIFHLTIEKRTPVGSTSMCVTHFPKYSDIDYDNRMIIRWIGSHADELLDMLYKRRK